MEEAFYQAAGFYMSDLSHVIRVGGAIMICMWCTWICAATLVSMDNQQGTNAKSILYRYFGAVLATVMVLFILGSE